MALATSLCTEMYYLINKEEGKTYESLSQNKTRTRMTRKTISDKMFLTTTTITNTMTNTRSKSSLDKRTSLYRAATTMTGEPTISAAAAVPEN